MNLVDSSGRLEYFSDAPNATFFGSAILVSWIATMEPNRDRPNGARR